MGEKSRRTAKFQAEHPKCCLCGGGLDTETIEHAPPIVMFWGKIRPKGMEVPACKRCNNGTGAADQLAAFFAIMQSPEFHTDFGNEEKLKCFDKISRGCKSNIPNFTKFFKSDGELYIKIKGVYQPQHRLKFETEIFSNYLNMWAAKQAIAHWYVNTNSIFSEDGIVFVRWLTNFEFLRNPRIENLVSSLGNIAELIQGSLNSEGQFSINYATTKDEDNIHVMCAAYHGTAFMAAMIDNKELELKLKTNALGSHAAAFRTKASTGIYEVEFPTI